MNFTILRYSLLLLAMPMAYGFATAQELIHLSTVKLGGFDEGAAEMVAFDAKSKQLFSINSEEKNISVIDLSDPTAAKLSRTLDISEFGKAPTCVSTNGSLVAVTVTAKDKQSPGKIAFFTTAGDPVGSVGAGALPDNVEFSPDGKLCIAANEGEPNDEYTNDPEGSVTIVDVSSDKPGEVTQITFGDLKAEDGVRLFGPNATLAQDLEPEFVAISGDSKTAWVVCQENNAVLTIDLETKKVTSLKGLGTKDHSKEGNGFDASDKSDAINIKPWPVKGMYQPDGMCAFQIEGKTFIATANEGDARDYVIKLTNDDEKTIFSEETRVEKLKLDPEKFPNAAELQDKAALGRLKTTNTLGDTDGDGDIDEIYSFGARSFSIWDEEWNLVFDSGDEFEQVTAKALSNGFNSTNDEADTLKDRSDDKGPEPECVTIGKIGEKTYAFIGLERVGGVMVYDVSTPSAAKFVSYSNHRNFEADIESAEAGDLGPEDVEFIPAAESPNGKDLIVTASEVSGTISVFEVK